MIEVWKDIKDYQGYQVSSFGRVRTHGKTSFTKRHGIRHWADRILKQKIYSTSSAKRKDARVDLWNDKGHKTFLVARLVATAFLGESDLTVNHIDGNSLNNTIYNLEWCSRKENIVKAFNSDLYPTKKITLATNGNYISFRSLSSANKYLGRCHGYISLCITNNRQIRDINNNVYKIIESENI